MTISHQIETISRTRLDPRETHSCRSRKCRFRDSRIAAAEVAAAGDYLDVSLGLKTMTRGYCTCDFFQIEAKVASIYGH